MHDTTYQLEFRSLTATLTDLARYVGAEMLCAWHRSCDLPAEGTCRHPVLGAVAICQRCADDDHLQIIRFQTLSAVA
jgi:hypothetical protein